MYKLAISDNACLSNWALSLNKVTLLFSNAASISKSMLNSDANNANKYFVPAAF